MNFAGWDCIHAGSCIGKSQNLEKKLLYRNLVLTCDRCLVGGTSDMYTRR